MATVYERVKKVVVDKLSVDEDAVILESAFVDTLNADSLDLVELIMALEEEFSDSDKKIEISDSEAEKILTVENAVNYLKDKGVQDE